MPRNYFDPNAPDYEPPEPGHDLNIAVLTADKDFAAELAEHLLENHWVPHLCDSMEELQPKLDDELSDIVMLDEPSDETWKACLRAQVRSGNDRPVIMIWAPQEEVQGEVWNRANHIVVEKPCTTAKIDAGLESFLGTRRGMTSKPTSARRPQSRQSDAP